MRALQHLLEYQLTPPGLQFCSLLHGAQYSKSGSPTGSGPEQAPAAAATPAPFLRPFSKRAQRQPSGVSGLFRLAALHSDNPGFPEGFWAGSSTPIRLPCSSSALLAPSQPGCPSCGILGESPPPLSPLPREVLQHPSCAVRAGAQIREAVPISPHTHPGTPLGVSKGRTREGTRPQGHTLAADTRQSHSLGVNHKYVCPCSGLLLCARDCTPVST